MNTLGIGRLAAIAAVLLLAGCATVPRDSDIAASRWAQQSGATHAACQPWVHRSFPGKKPNHFAYARIDGRDTIAVQADSSVSMLHQALRIEPRELGHVRFSWKVPALIAQADLALREQDDAPVRIVLAFEGDRSRFSPRDAALSELVRALTGEELPYATLMYVWGNRRAPGTVLNSPRTDRIRRLVVESGPAGLNQWNDYERDIRADYEHAFGEPPGALVGIAIMTDSDNTRSQARAWYGPVRLLPVAAH
ncbi:DUF3047 domain-containing protein [Ramlibacter sp.]|uniref:DUF3047 domain-containing protein n=1 Tax=Ramlibacter sp. TaxID=1917967 RepID=UPI0026237200|nr:DUF3047 domain-containing protein [Ramlibacter sp.]MDB5954165.1 hypothetical protein [Ramlibacter sp.]